MIFLLYDGWNLIAESAGNDAPARSYTWGLDASGSMQGAGGVGGLLMVNAGSGGVHFPAYDLNGNVIGLVNAANGNISAKYEYGPFGEVFCSVGDMAKVNPFQFSTKYTDSETDLVYYGYRYYSPSLGRWLSRDPIEEQGGLNLYGFVNNDPVNMWDRLGLAAYRVGDDDPFVPVDEGMGEWNSNADLFSFKDDVAVGSTINFARSVLWLFRFLPDANAHLNHYLGGSGKDYTIRFKKLLADCKEANKTFTSEKVAAKKFVETLPNGIHSIVAEKATLDGVLPEESKNWYYAVGNYYVWGKGVAYVCGNEYILKFNYKFKDRYNWDYGKSIRNGRPRDEVLGSLHQMGLAREFDMFGSVKETLKWKKGKTPEVSQGWNSRKGRSR